MKKYDSNTRLRELSTMSFERLCFEAEAYGAEINHDEKIVAVPMRAKDFVLLNYICNKLKYDKQIGIIH